ncbi:MAG: O-antigen ligase family protein, partial [bacterium]
MGQYVGFEPLPWASHFKPRIFATLGNPVFLGGFMAVAFPLAFARWLTAEREETKDLLTLLLGALGLACYLTWTRGSWLAVLGSSVVVLGVLAADARGRAVLTANRAWLLALAIAGVVAGSMVSSTQVLGNAPVPVADRLRDAFNPRGYSFRFRLVTNEVALRIARDHPLLGGGPGNFPVAYPGRRLGTRAAASSPEHFFASQEAYAHDDHAQILAETGVIGLGLWLWLLAAAFRWAWSRWRREDWLGLAAIGCLAGLALDGLLNFPLRIAPTAWMGFTVLGLLGADPDARRAPTRRAGPVWRPLAAAALIAACGGAVVHPVYARLTADHYLLEGDRQVGYNNYEMASVYYGMGAERAPTDRFLAFRSSVAL